MQVVNWVSAGNTECVQQTKVVSYYEGEISNQHVDGITHLHLLCKVIKRLALLLGCFSVNKAKWGCSFE